MARPIITRLSDPWPHISLNLVKEFIGLDPDIDAEQDKVLRALVGAAIDQGQQITGIVWAETKYRIDGVCPPWSGAGFLFPLTPVFSVKKVEGRDAAGVIIFVPDSDYTLIPSAIEFGRPWPELRPVQQWPDDAVSFSVTCVAGWDLFGLPDSLLSWALTRIATMYDDRADLGAGKTSMPRHHARGLLDRWTVRAAFDG